MLQLTHERIRAVKKTECVSYGHVEQCTLHRSCTMGREQTSSLGTTISMDFLTSNFAAF